MDNNDNKNKLSNNLKRNKYLIYLLLISISLILGGIGFAFFSANVSNTNHETISTETATLSLVFEDNDNGVSGNLSLEESIIKKFTIENIGTVDAYAKINWYNLINTYTSQSLTWVLEQSTTSNGTYTTIETGFVPTSNSLTTETLKNSILVPASQKYYYKLTIKLNDLDINQNNDINASFSSYFNLEEGSMSGTGSISGVDKIMNLVSGASPNSTNAINAQEVSIACTNTLAYDGTVDNNLRYIGANPCNYVCFNDECSSGKTVYYPARKDGNYDYSDYSEYVKDTEEECYALFDEEDYEYFECAHSFQKSSYGWRIIGVMNNVDDGTGKKETRLKIIREQPLGRHYYNTTNTCDGSSRNGLYGCSNLREELNGDYLNYNLTEDTIWYGETKTFNHNYTLKSSAQDLIDNAIWTMADNSDTNAINAYNRAKNSNISTNFWTGKIGINELSDYGLATNGYNGNSRNTCMDSILTTIGTACLGDNYLLPDSYTYVMNLCFGTSSVHALSARAGVRSSNVFPHEEGGETRPNIYLKSDVKITGGNGSHENLFILSN